MAPWGNTAGVAAVPRVDSRVVKGPWPSGFFLHLYAVHGFWGLEGHREEEQPLKQTGERSEGCCAPQSQGAQSHQTMNYCRPRSLPHTPSVSHQQGLGSQLWVLWPTQRVLLSRPWTYSAFFWWAAQNCSLCLPAELRGKRAILAGVFPCVFMLSLLPSPN